MYHFLKPHRKLLQVNNASFCSIYLPLLGVFACLASFSLPCRNLSSISCKALSLFIQECLNSSLLFEQFWQYCILDRLFLSFSILKVVSTHCLLVSEISDAKSVLLGPCRTCFSPNAFKISVPFRNLMVSGSCLSYLELKSLGCLWSLIHLLRDLLTHYVFKYSHPFSSVSSETPTMRMLLFMFHRSLRFYLKIFQSVISIGLS